MIYSEVHFTVFDVNLRDENVTRKEKKGLNKVKMKILKFKYFLILFRNSFCKSIKIDSFSLKLSENLPKKTYRI